MTTTASSGKPTTRSSATSETTSSTITGRPLSCDGPDGQAQFYSYDWQAQPFQRGSAYLPADGHMFELDDDYNTTHDSSPECSYCGGQYGRTIYEDHWCSRRGNGAPCDWGYSPTPIAYQGWLDAADCNVVAGWAWDAGKSDAHISVAVYLDGTWIARLPAISTAGICRPPTSATARMACVGAADHLSRSYVVGESGQFVGRAVGIAEADRPRVRWIAAWA